MKFSFGAEFKDTFVQYIYICIIYKTRRAVKEDEEENFLGETDARGEGGEGRYRITKAREDGWEWRGEFSPRGPVVAPKDDIRGPGLGDGEEGVRRKLQRGGGYSYPDDDKEATGVGR